MPTIQSSIEAALFARVASLTLSPAMPVAWPNRAFPGLDAQGEENPKPASYLRVTHVPNIARRLFLGSTDPHQRLGLLQVDVFTPLNKGASAATEIAGKVAEHFACDLKMVSGDVTVRIQKAPDVAQAMADDAYWFVPTTVTYEAYA